MAGEPDGGVVRASVPRERPAPETYRSAARIANVTIAFLTLAVVFNLAAVVVDGQMLGLLYRVRAGETVTFDQATAHDERMFLAAMLQLAGVALAGVPFVLWLRRVYRNLRPLGAGTLRFKPGWAVGGWFVPFLWFARPKSITNDVWRASSPELPPEFPEPPRGAPVPAWINWWWTTFLVGAMVHPGDFDTGLDPSLDELVLDVQRTVFADATLVASGVLAIVLVRRITVRQEQRRAALSVGAAGEPLRRERLPEGL